MLWNISRALLSLTWTVSICIAVLLIKLLTFTWGKHGKVTKFKIWRIRRFTELKIWLYRNHRSFCRMIDREIEFSYIEKKFGR